MAKKIVKKAPAGAKPMVAKSAAAPAAAMTPAAAAPCCGGAGCCRKGFGHFLKKLLVVLIIFIIGFMAGKFYSHAQRFHGMGFGRMEFVNGCLDMSKIKCPKMAAKFAAMDTNGDGCITKDEVWAAKKAMMAMHHPAMDGECPDEE